eukprot:scaffold301_cov243-Pinguiococcus_pyrenoidosus.AAC.14
MLTGLRWDMQVASFIATPTGPSSRAPPAKYQTGREKLSGWIRWATKAVNTRTSACALGRWRRPLFSSSPRLTEWLKMGPLPAIGWRAAFFFVS